MASAGRGFLIASSPPKQNWQYPHYFFAASELPAAVERVPWPEFVLDNNVQVIAANTATQALWQIDFEKERATRTRAPR